MVDDDLPWIPDSQHQGVDSYLYDQPNPHFRGGTPGYIKGAGVRGPNENDLEMRVAIGATLGLVLGAIVGTLIGPYYFIDSSEGELCFQGGGAGAIVGIVTGVLIDWWVTR